MEALKDEVDEITLEDPQEIEKTKPIGEVTPISIHPDYLECHVMIETKLIKELRKALVEFLKKNYDVFSWSQGDILGIDPQVAVHKLFTNPDHSPVRQKRRKFAPKCLKFIKDEMAKFIKDNVIRESHYPD